jgi:hypothetical protein
MHVTAPAVNYLPSDWMVYRDRWDAAYAFSAICSAVAPASLLAGALGGSTQESRGTAARSIAASRTPAAAAGAR